MTPLRNQHKYKHKPKGDGWDLLEFMHCSMQFSDTSKQKWYDAEKLFDRADERGVVALTGTEAGGGKSRDLRHALEQEANQYEFRFFAHPDQDSWVAINSAFIDSDFDNWYSGVLVDGDAGHHTAKRVIGSSWNNDIYGPMTQAVCHYLTKGRPDGKSPEYERYLKQNQHIAETIGNEAERRGKGNALFWYSGDQNIVDRANDTFLGRAKLTSAADELKVYPDTGHGNIDVIASYDLDSRVKAEYFRALDDKEFHLFTDHYLIEAGFWVKRLEAAA